MNTYFLGIDLGLHFGFACIDQNKEIIFRGSKNLSNRQSLKKLSFQFGKFLNEKIRSPEFLKNHAEMNIHLCLEGDKALASLWIKSLQKEICFKEIKMIGAEEWRNHFKIPKGNKAMYLNFSKEKLGLKNLKDHNEAEALLICLYHFEMTKTSLK